MPQRTPRPKTVYRRWIAEIEAPLHALVRSELQLGSTTAARNLIKGGSVRVSDEQVKIPSTVVKVGQEICPRIQEENWSVQTPPSPFVRRMTFPLKSSMKTMICCAI